MIASCPIIIVEVEQLVLFDVKRILSSF